ncbi:arnC [Acrasis kona]|uniref:ArnC n=1 Tax=Acrasis kona TaxID=1008807 RepID=A0AAW2Z611_9EUKA
MGGGETWSKESTELYAYVYNYLGLRDIKTIHSKFFPGETYMRVYNKVRNNPKVFVKEDTAPLSGKDCVEEDIVSNTVKIIDDVRKGLKEGRSYRLDQGSTKKRTKKTTAASSKASEEHEPYYLEVRENIKNKLLQKDSEIALITKEKDAARKKRKSHDLDNLNLQAEGKEPKRQAVGPKKQSEGSTLAQRHDDMVEEYKSNTIVLEGLRGR